MLSPKFITDPAVSLARSGSGQAGSRMATNETDIRDVSEQPVSPGGGLGQIAHSISQYMRKRRSIHLAQLIQSVFDAKGSVSIIDIGGEPDYWSQFSQNFLEDRAVAITIVNVKKLGENNGIFSFEEGDGCALRYADSTFDIAHSNSVIEHVGSWDMMRAFAKETQRLAPAYYVQTPSFWFPIEPHFLLPGFHWLPRSARMVLVQRFACGYHQRCTSTSEAAHLVDSASLLSKRQMECLFRDAVILHERLVLTKSFMAIRPWPSVR